MKSYAVIEKKSSENITTQIREDLKKRILNGEWLPNGRLPSERELSDFYKVSRLSVRHALTELVQTNIVYRAPTKGTFVKDQRDIKEKYYRGRCVGLVICPTLSVHFSKILLSISRNLSKHEWGLIQYYSEEDALLERKYIEKLVSNNIQGLIVVSGKESGKNIPLLAKISLNIPVLTIDIGLKDIKTDFIFSDDERGAFEAVIHLIELGHKKILHLAGNDSFSTAKLRRLGYENALADNDIELDEKLIRTTDWSLESGYNETKKFLMNNKDQMTAIFACDDKVAYGAYKAIREMGLRVPEDISIVGYGNLGDYSEILLTTVDQNPERMGEEAVSLLLGKLNKERPLECVEKVTIPTSLIIRESCGIKIKKKIF